MFYDSCVPEPYYISGDVVGGEDEKWYLLDDGINMQHIGHSNGPTEIKYFIHNLSKDGNSSWNYITNQTMRENVKTWFINGVCKWNNICFYKQNGSNYISKHNLVNISEGTLNNHNLSIYPEVFDEDNSTIAYAVPSDNCSSVLVDSYLCITHHHCDKWDIVFNLFYYQTYDEIYLGHYGAHEFGHVLGLVDVDGCECHYPDEYHHAELLMGYESPFRTEITYKDLIGAAITRGLHTDLDHKWIYRSIEYGSYKLICSVCNCIKYVSSLDGIDYVTYKYCNDEHDLADGNMFAVASYGNSDYYKCKYCRYVAPFDDIEPQNYTKTQYNSSNHIVTNQVTGLGYSFYENHSFDTTHTCTLCGAQYSHSYTHHYENYSSTHHEAYCECGASVLDFHAANFMQSYIFNGHIYAPCIFCSATLDLGGNGPIIPVPGSINQMVTDNGSYIMPNGIYVIMEEDLEAFLSGTLVFHPYGEVEA